MGGGHCEIPWKATVRYRALPTHPKDLKELESQLRQAYAIPSIYDEVVEQGMDREVCATLVKEDLTVTDLGRLLQIGEDLYEYENTPEDA